MKDVGLVGVPYSGKSTLFTALTRTGAAGGRANQAVVSVPDARLHVLAELERSRKVVAAQVRFVDVPGGARAQGLAALREVDALCVVVRAFGPGADSSGELREVLTDLILTDMATVESALDNARKRAKGRSGTAADVRALEKAHAALSSERPLRDAGLDHDERLALLGLAPLSLKPFVVVANLVEGADLPTGLPDGTYTFAVRQTFSWQQAAALIQGVEPISPVPA